MKKILLSLGLGMMSLSALHAADAVPSGVVISEFLYDQPGNELEPQGEWIVLENRGKEPVNMVGYSVTDSWNKDGKEGKPYIIQDDVTLAPGQKVILANNIMKFKELYPGVPEDIKILECGGDKGIELRNTGEFIRLKNPGGDLVSEVVYGDLTGDHKPEEIAPKGHPGQSLRLVDGIWVAVDKPWGVSSSK